MRAGALDREITIEVAAESVSAAGETVQVWSTFAECWAAVKPLSATERFKSDARHSARVSVFTIRYVSGVLRTMRIVYEGLNWRILGIAEVNRREGLDITAEAVY